ncbi:hypothetical protein Np050604_214 [Cyanophage S-RIM44]|uniref:LamG-like jellyroll fold domain-containing protein n=2 Tax=Vellamovirus TaxID=2733139 RepID=A0A140IER2_9CAUD|nr:virion structural protein [Prochlorococcus phage Syn1]ADO99313.1 hypothetical protein Syn1_217 [Prochlorococcus phage Syn1]AMO43453.1 hypothetical protein W270710_214 [Cyanophage S-RIM44]AOO11925.1 hypothetical protein Np050604_214 [Cyanophage S-RIM44]AOO12626.1 hypothetical protein Sn080709_214 [Cyanophage S-RIM44]
MPVGFNSPARNFFLLGSSGLDIVTNFFKTIVTPDQNFDAVYRAEEIRYDYNSDTYTLAGWGQDNNSTEYGWVENRNYNTATGGSTETWRNLVKSSIANNDLRINALEVDNGYKVVAVGLANDFPFIARYDGLNGTLDFQSTSNSGDVNYTGIAVDINQNYYACGNTSAADQIAYVEKYDSNGNPGWGKSASYEFSNVTLEKISVNSKGEVVAVGTVFDDAGTKGYIVKLDSSTGDVLWDKTLERSSENQTLDIVLPTAVYIDSADFIYVVGRFEDTTSDKSFIIKYSPEGNLLWQRETVAGGNPLEYYEVKADGNTGQIIVFGRYFDTFNNDEMGLLTKYSRSGDLVWRRTIKSSYNQALNFGFEGGAGIALDFDASFYYLLFTDDILSVAGRTPETYTFGKVSSSGNGLGEFVYNDGLGENMTYTIIEIPDRIGRIQDGSVRIETSGLISYPFNANKLLFDDFATSLANKKRQLKDDNVFQYSGSPAIRVADFQELNLLGDVYSGSGDWLDQSGKGNDGYTSTGEPFYGGGGVLFDGDGDYLQIVRGSNTDLAFGTQDFTIEFFANFTKTGMRIMSTGDNGNYTTGGWVFETNNQFGVADSAGNFAYYGTFTYPTNSWAHISVVRNGSNIYGFVNGVQQWSNTISTNITFSGTNDFSLGTGRSGSSGLGAYNLSSSFMVEGAISNLRIVKGTALYTANFTPPTTSLTAIAGTELLICQGNTIADASSNNFAITVNGNPSDTIDGPTHNAAGYWEFDGVDDDIIVNNPDLHYEEMSFEWWLWNDTTQSINTYIGKRNNSSNGYMIFRWNGGRLFFDYGGAVNRWDTGWVVPNTQWVHCVLTRDGNGRKLYVNGVEEASSILPGDYITSTLGVGIGDISSADNYYTDGRIGEVRIYPRALTAAQVFQNYNATKSKYINEAPDTAPKIGPGIVYDSNLLLNYDFGNRATYDRAENLLKYSEQVDGLNYTNPDWGRNGSIDFEYPTDILSPFGTSGVSKFTRTGGGTVYVAQDSFATLEAGKQYTFSLYIKKGTSGKFGLELGDGGDNIRTNFDIDTLLFSNTSATQDFTSLDETGYTDLGNGWYRIWITGTVSASPSGGIFAGDGLVNVALYFTANNVGEYGYVWGAQVNEGGIGRYIKTTTFPITAPTTVKNLSNNLYTATMGVIGNAPDFNSTGYFSFDATNDEVIALDGTVTDPFPKPTNPSIEVWGWKSNWDDGAEGRIASCTQGGGYQIGVGETLMGSANVGSIMYVNGVYAVTQYARSNLSSGWHHFVGTFDGATLRFYVDGTEVDTDSSRSGNVTYPTPTDFLIGGEPGAAGFPDTAKDLTGRVGQVRVYDRALSSTEVSQNFNATRSKYGV